MIQTWNSDGHQHFIGTELQCGFPRKLLKDFSEMRETSVIQYCLKEGHDEDREEGREEGVKRSELKGVMTP